MISPIGPRIKNIFSDGKNQVFHTNDTVFGAKEAKIDESAAQVVAKYDKDGDGSIDVKSESTRTAWSGLGEVNRSIENLATRADYLGDRDGKASAAEIAAVMKSYDKDGISAFPFHLNGPDGTLKGSELSKFETEVGETETAVPHTPVIWHEQPPSTPFPPSPYPPLIPDPPTPGSGPSMPPGCHDGDGMFIPITGIHLAKVAQDLSPPTAVRLMASDATTQA